LASHPAGKLIVAVFSFSEGFYIHLGAYMILTLLWATAALGKSGSFLIASATGALLELLQMLFPNRYASLGDMSANILGAFIGYAILAVVLRWGPRGVTRKPLYAGQT
jgi:VanZ family protein